MQTNQGVITHMIHLNIRHEKLITLLTNMASHPYKPVISSDNSEFSTREVSQSWVSWESALMIFCCDERSWFCW